MDFNSIAAFAAMSLAPYLSKSCDALATEVGKNLPQKVGNLYSLIKTKFGEDSEAEQVLSLVEKNPNSQGRLKALEEELAKKMENDPLFAEDVDTLLKEIGSDYKYNLIIVASGEKSVAAQVIKGSIIATGDGNISIGSKPSNKSDP